MEHLGDITMISGHKIAPVDVVTGGSPCQDLSIAGNRAGLAGARSGLYMEQIRIIKEMRDADIHRGRTGQLVRPRFMVWENVPGAFSSNRGEDFRAVLEEAARVVEPDAVIPGPPGGRWRTAGRVLGDGWSMAWRVLDAQFWGVPQRRRRIALVVDFGGHAAPEILFVRKSVSGDIDPGTEAGEAAASGIGGGAYPAVARSLTARYDGSPCTDRGPNIVMEAAALRMRAGCEGGGKGALIQVEKSGTLGGQNDQTVFCAAFKGGQGAKARSIGYAEEVSPALTAADCGSNRAPCVFENHGQDRGLTGPLVAAPTVARKIGADGDNTPLVLRKQNFGEYREGVGTLTAHNGTRHTGEILVVAGVDCRNARENGDLCGTLQCGARQGFSYNCVHPVRIGKTVRRLTPVECERLQGFPDGWTDIGPWTDSKGKEHKESSDSARYKALGNSIALPPWRWVLLRLCGCYERPATLGSLFDGIGGFPLIWERINGPGTALWASEIEELPIAVTRCRFSKEITWEGI